MNPRTVVQSALPSARRSHTRPPERWKTDVAVSKARYRGADLGSFGLDGPYIANAPEFIGSFGVLVSNLGRWSGGLQWRILGAYPINDGEENPKDSGYSEANVDVDFKLTRRIKLGVAIYNLTNTKADAAAYYYAARLPGEPVGGVNDFQVHPLEPVSARFTLTAIF